ncbi:hypothetical protein GALL_422250 [mine drainage metagenome]|uniref:Uncharacterized protein n=1 Tax=mine drainage metagenome TaxID=410659 RepID=A0A1J5Q7W7_9ZZZZ
MGCLADKVLRFHLRGQHAGFNGVVLGFKLCAKGTVGLLEASRGSVNTDADGDETVWLSGIPDQLPEFGTLFHWQVKLPTEISYVGDARCKDAQRSNLDDLALAEGEGCVGKIAGGDALQNLAGLWTPDAKGRVVRREVFDLGSAICRQVVAEPLLVSHSVRTTGYDAESVVGQAHDREVGLESTIVREHWRVDDSSDGYIHLAHCNFLHHV